MLASGAESSETLARTGTGVPCEGTEWRKYMRVAGCGGSSLARASASGVPSPRIVRRTHVVLPEAGTNEQTLWQMHRRGSKWGTGWRAWSSEDESAFIRVRIYLPFRRCEQTCFRSCASSLPRECLGLA